MIRTEFGKTIEVLPAINGTLTQGQLMINKNEHF